MKSKILGKRSPGTVRLVWRTDVHASDRTPQSRTDNWMDTVRDKLLQVGEIAREVQANAVLDGGDFFNIKSPSRNSHELVGEIAKIHRQYPCGVYANVGNHDCKYGDYAFLEEQPLGVLFNTNIFRRLYDEHELVIQSTWDYDNGYGDFGTRDGARVRVVGIPYHGVSYDMERFKSIKRKHPKEFLVVAAHVLASPTGGTMFEGEDIVKYSDLLTLNRDVDVWCFGHWHKDQGITEIAPGKYVVNVGSLTRGSLSEDNVERRPSCVVMEFQDRSYDKITLEQRFLNVRPSAEVFNLVSRVRQESRDMNIDAFVGSLQNTLSKGSDTPLPDLIRQLTVPSQVKERALAYLEQSS